MIFLGQASNYSFTGTLRHLFAWGKKDDSVKLKEAFAKRYHAPVSNIRLYHTGRSALCAAIQATVPTGSKVILPGLTCIAVVRAIKAAGCTPVFADIDPKTLQYDFKHLDKIAKVCYNGGIIVQNTLGLPLDISKLESIAEKNHLVIIEDLAHSAGRFYPDGREIGTVGQAAALSFGKGKAIDTISGGAAIWRSEPLQEIPEPTQKPNLASRLRDRWYPVFGGLARGLWRIGLGRIFIGGLVKLHFVERSADAKLNLTTRLTHWQAKLALHELNHLPNTPLREHYLVKRRSALLDQLEKNGYYLREIWYDTPVSPARYADEVTFPAEDCPATVRVAEEIINLPTWYPEQKLEKARTLIAEHLQEAGDE